MVFPHFSLKIWKPRNRAETRKPNPKKELYITYQLLLSCFLKRQRKGSSCNYLQLLIF
jgi:hypothetical protein